MSSDSTIVDIAQDYFDATTLKIARSATFISNSPLVFFELLSEIKYSQYIRIKVNRISKWLLPGTESKSP